MSPTARFPSPTRAVGLALSPSEWIALGLSADSINLAITTAALQLNVGFKAPRALSVRRELWRSNHRVQSPATSLAAPRAGFNAGFDLSVVFGLDIDTTGAVDTAGVHITGATVSIPGIA